MPFELPVEDNDNDDHHHHHHTFWPIFQLFFIYYGQHNSLLLFLLQLFYYYDGNWFYLCLSVVGTTQPDNNNYLSLRVEIYLLRAACKLSRQFLLHYSVFCLLNWSAKKNSFLSMKLSENSKDTLLRLLRHIFIHINHCYKRKRKKTRRKRGR